MGVFAVLALAGPLLLLATTVARLWSSGPWGWLAAVLLLVGCAAATRWLVRTTRRWWRGTKAPAQRRTTPAEARRR